MGYALPRVNTPPRVSIDLRENIGQMYAGRGWQFEYPQANYEDKFSFVWARGDQSEIYFSVGNAADRTKTLNAYAESPQKVGLTLNGERIGEIALTAEWKDYRITLPARLLKTQMNVVRLGYSADLTETVGMTTITIE
jgi:hypothetical protein